MCGRVNSFVRNSRGHQSCNNGAEVATETPGFWRSGTMYYLLRNFYSQGIASLRESLDDKAGKAGLLKHAGA